ncbi:ABC transporter permease, partial [Staphylococcus aureus]|uniref:ABC transporter permease n=1 Tax=Staphylococcus aureus TaxID=1280 RepID=UPI0035E3ED0C
NNALKLFAFQCKMYLGHVKVLLGMFLSLKTLYRKRTVIWPFYFYTIIRTLSKFQNILLMIMIIPTWINLLLKTYAFIGLLSHDGVINQFFHLFNLPSFNLLFTTGAFLVVASYIYIPFMILPIFNSMKAIPNNLLQASSDLGASPFYTFRKVIMPLTKEGVMTGIQVTFIPSLSLFMITRLIAGNKVINIGTAIEEQFLTIQNYGMGSTIAIFLIVFMAFILIITKSSNGRG